MHAVPLERSLLAGLTHLDCTLLLCFISLSLSLFLCLAVRCLLAACCLCILQVIKQKLEVDIARIDTNLEYALVSLSSATDAHWENKALVDAIEEASEKNDLAYTIRYAYR